MKCNSNGKRRNVDEGLRLLGITASEEYGGLNLGYQAHCIAMEELSQASGASIQDPKALRAIVDGSQGALAYPTPRTLNCVSISSPSMALRSRKRIFCRRS